VNQGSCGNSWNESAKGVDCWKGEMMYAFFMAATALLSARRGGGPQDMPEGVRLSCDVLGVRHIDKPNRRDAFTRATPPTGDILVDIGEEDPGFALVDRIDELQSRIAREADPARRFKIADELCTLLGEPAEPEPPLGSFRGA